MGNMWLVAAAALCVVSMCKALNFGEGQGHPLSSESTTGSEKMELASTKSETSSKATVQQVTGRKTTQPEKAAMLDALDDVKNQVKTRSGSYEGREEFAAERFAGDSRVRVEVKYCFMEEAGCKAGNRIDAATLLKNLNDLLTEASGTVNIFDQISFFAQLECLDVLIQVAYKVQQGVGGKGSFSSTKSPNPNSDIELFDFPAYNYNINLTTEIPEFLQTTLSKVIRSLSAAPAAAHPSPPLYGPHETFVETNNISNRIRIAFTPSNSSPTGLITTLEAFKNYVNNPERPLTHPPIVLRNKDMLILVELCLKVERVQIEKPHQRKD